MITKSKSSLFRRVSFACTFFIGAGLSSLTAHAHQASLAEAFIDGAEESGIAQEGETAGGDAQIKASVRHDNEDHANSYIYVVFRGCAEDAEIGGKPIANLEGIIRKGREPSKDIRWQKPGPGWRICPEPNRILLTPQEQVSIVLSVDFLRIREGGLAAEIIADTYVLEPSDVEDTSDFTKMDDLVSKRSPDARLPIRLHYRMSRSGEWVYGSYEEIFGTPAKSIDKLPTTEDYNDVRKEMPVDVFAYRRDLLMPGSLVADKGRRLRENLKFIDRTGSGLAGDRIIDRERLQLRKRDLVAKTYIPRGNGGISGGGILRSASSFSSSESMPLKASSRIAFNLSGRFSTKWTTDHSLHPGFGFRAVAYSNESGRWRQLGWSWVQSDGRWNISIPDSAGYRGRHLRMVYFSDNAYVKPQNRDGNTYAWADPDRVNIAANFSAGHRFADTDGGRANGLGELADAAMVLWSQLYWSGGINPVDSDPYDVFFPNTWDNCGGSSPWSCASTNGDIWLIASHGTQADVVFHELAHQLNNLYWDRKRPAGSGGSHSLNTCYPTRLGMALREGFANYVSAWAGYPERNTAQGGFGSGRYSLAYDPEQSSNPPNCNRGWENEVWVARTFWDLHDTRSDSDDILWFVNRGAVMSLYLANGVASNGDARDMRDYESIYRSAASSGHQSFISDIFEQNNH